MGRVALSFFNSNSDKLYLITGASDTTNKSGLPDAVTRGWWSLIFIK
jgi:hypothetical protein